MKGNKTDRKDAKWICDLYMCGMVKPSFIPPADIRELRDLVRYRFKLTCMITGEKNRAQNCLTVSNLKLDDVFSDVFGKSSRSITEQILHTTSLFQTYTIRNFNYGLNQIGIKIDMYRQEHRFSPATPVFRRFDV